MLLPVAVCRAANASYSAAMYVVVFLVLAALAGLIWFGLQGWERLVRIRREQEPTST
tara:strand:+ start:12818 stop:12988 length:171 start_codon:yes stop_codon:yes gene_type:complete